MRLKSPSSPCPIASCSNMPGHPGPQQHRHLARGCRDRVEIDQRLSQRFVDRTVPRRFVEQRVVKIASAQSERPALAPPARVLRDDADVQADERPNVACDKAIGTNDVDHAPASRQRDRNLRDARVAGTRGGVDRLTKRNLVRERYRAQRIARGIKMPVASTRRGGGRAFRRVEQTQRLRRAPDRRFVDTVGVSKARHLAADPAQAKAGVGAVIGGLHAPVVEPEALGHAVLQI